MADPAAEAVFIGTERARSIYWLKAEQDPVAETRIHARQAAAALLKMAKTTSDPNIAAGLVEAAADLKEQAGELPPVIEAATDIRPGAKER